MNVSVTAARCFLILAAGFFATQTIAMDFVEAAPKQTKVLVDNEKVRVIRATFKKGDKITVRAPGKVEESTFTLDATKTPMRIAITDAGAAKSALDSARK